MADYYCDHENTTLYPSAYMSVPANAASLPQDGDGKASGTGPSPAVSSASWDLTGASASAGTMTIFGASITSLTASGSALATAIATAINASTASAATAANGNIASVYLKALVWAVASGATLTVYSRIASADLNYANNTACQMAVGAGWTAPPSAAQFAGGVSGPWRYFINPVALTTGVSASVSGAFITYGAFKQTVMGNPGAADRIVVRTKRAGSDVACNCASASSCDVTSLRTCETYFDSGVAWAGNDGVFQLTLSSTHGAVPLSFYNAGNGLINGNGQRLRVLFQPIASTFQGAMVAPGSAGSGSVVRSESILFEISSLCGTSSNVKFRTDLTANCSAAFRRCKFVVSKLNTYYPAQFGTSNSINGSASLIMEDCDIVFTGLSSAPSGKLFYALKAAQPVLLLVRNVRIYDQNDLSLRFPLLDAAQAGSTPLTAFICQFENVSGASVLPADFGTSLLGSVVPTINLFDYQNNIVLIDSKTQGAYRQESLHGYTDWIPGESRPTLSALLPDGTPWAVRILWYGQYLTGYAPFQVRSAQLFTDASAIKTITAQLLFSSDITPADITSAAVVMTVSYTGSDGKQYSETTHPVGDPVELTAGSAAWVKTGVYSAYTPKKLAVTTAVAIQQNTMVEIVVSFVKNCPAAVAGKQVFFDPEFGIV